MLYVLGQAVPVRWNKWRLYGDCMVIKWSNKSVNPIIIIRCPNASICIHNLSYTYRIQDCSEGSKDAIANIGFGMPKQVSYLKCVIHHIMTTLECIDSSDICWKDGIFVCYKCLSTNDRTTVSINQLCDYVVD